MKNISLYKLAKGRCWTGYEPVPGKEPYSPGSCRPAGSKKKKKKSKEASALTKKLDSIHYDYVRPKSASLPNLNTALFKKLAEEFGS